MSISGRWQLGDVIIWFQTGSVEDAKTDSDVFLRFYDENNALIGWVKAFERSDLGGFEQGELNCGYLGNINRQSWLKSLYQRGTRLGISIDKISEDRPDWFVDRISLDFRVGPLPETSTVRYWQLDDWIAPLDGESLFDCEALTEKGDSHFEDVGFESELELESGGAEVMSE